MTALVAFLLAATVAGKNYARFSLSQGVCVEFTNDDSAPDDDRFEQCGGTGNGQIKGAKVESYCASLDGFRARPDLKCDNKGRDKCICYTTYTETVTPKYEDCSCRCQHQWSGWACNDCEIPFGGANCSECATNHINYPLCTECNRKEHCNGRGAAAAVNETSCGCNCDNKWTGDRCETCPAAYDDQQDCNKCSSGYHRVGSPCVECNNLADCNGRASYITTTPANEAKCDCHCAQQWTGDQCENCDTTKYQQIGNDCNTCRVDRFNFPDCVLCTNEDFCNGRATPGGTYVENDKCKCYCKVPWAGPRCTECPAQYAGSDCDTCSPGNTNFPQCTPCDKATTCHGHAESITSDGTTCTCTCRNQWTKDPSGEQCAYCDPIYDAGRDCGACAPGRINYPQCTLCEIDKNCNDRASAVRTNAAQDTCVCSCRNKWTDPHPENGTCSTCHPQFSGTDCEKCANGHIGYDNVVNPCRPCTNVTDCSNNAILVTSDRDNHFCMCSCRNEWSGFDCSVCKDIYDNSTDCSRCAVGRIGFPNCDQCSIQYHCNNRATRVYTNDEQTTCMCACSNYWTGASCAECPVEFGGLECDRCAEHFFNNATDGDPLVCIPVLPDVFVFQSMGNFEAFGRAIDPPLIVHLEDDNQRQIQGSEASSVNCTCTLWECETVSRGEAYRYTEAPMFGESSPPGQIYCCMGKPCVADDGTVHGKCEDNLGDKHYDDKCKAISVQHSVIGKKGCRCGNLTPLPPADEKAEGDEIRERLRDAEEWRKIAWFRPRRYEISVELSPISMHLPNQAQAVTVAPLVINVPQPRCADTSKLAVLRADSDPSCETCPEGLICNGTMNSYTRPNYWRATNEVLMAKECPFPNCGGTAPMISNTSDRGCVNGTSGTYCGYCSEEQRIGIGGCVNCPTKGISILFTTLCFIALIAGILGVVRVSLASTIQRPDPLPQYIKILMSVIQVLAVLQEVEIKWGSFNEELFGISSSAGSVAGVPVPLICLLPPKIDLSDRVWVWVFFPLFIAAEAYLASLVYAKKRPSKSEGRIAASVQRSKEKAEQLGKSMKTKVTGILGISASSAVASCTLTRAELRETEIIAFCAICNVEWADWRCKECELVMCQKCSVVCKAKMHVLDHEVPVQHEGTEVRLRKREVFSTASVVLMHFTFTLLIDQLTKPFICKEYLTAETGHQWIAVSDPRVSCDSSSMLYKVSVTFFLLYGFGIPLAIFSLLFYQKHNLARQRCVSAYGFLYTNYRKKHYYWESVVMLRKVLIVCAIALPETAYAKVFAATWVLFVALVLNLSFEPYRERRQQQLDSLGLFSGACSLLAALWVANSTINDESVSTSLLVGVAFFNTMTITLTFVAICLLLLGKYCKSKKEQKAAQACSDSAADASLCEASIEEARSEGATDVDASASGGGGSPREHNSADAASSPDKCIADDSASETEMLPMRAPFLYESNANFSDLMEVTQSSSPQALLPRATTTTTAAAATPASASPQQQQPPSLLLRTSSPSSPVLSVPASASVLQRPTTAAAPTAASSGSAASPTSASGKTGGCPAAAAAAGVVKSAFPLPLALRASGLGGGGGGANAAPTAAAASGGGSDRDPASPLLKRAYPSTNTLSNLWAPSESFARRPSFSTLPRVEDEDDDVRSAMSVVPAFAGSLVSSPSRRIAGSTALPSWSGGSAGGGAPGVNPLRHAAAEGGSPRSVSSPHLQTKGSGGGGSGGGGFSPRTMKVNLRDTLSQGTVRELREFFSEGTASDSPPHAGKGGAQRQASMVSSDDKSLPFGSSESTLPTSSTATPVSAGPVSAVASAAATPSGPRLGNKRSGTLPNLVNVPATRTEFPRSEASPLVHSALIL